jgi:hypothetical protein
MNFDESKRKIILQTFTRQFVAIPREGTRTLRRYHKKNRQTGTTASKLSCNFIFIIIIVIILIW